MNYTYHFKEERDRGLFTHTDARLQFVFMHLVLFCQSMNYPILVITSTIRSKMPWSVSATHQEGRALDIRSSVYTKEQIETMCKYLNDRYACSYGTGPENKVPRVLIYEPGSEGGAHFHLQVRR